MPTNPFRSYEAGPSRDVPKGKDSGSTSPDMMRVMMRDKQQSQSLESREHPEVTQAHETDPKRFSREEVVEYLRSGKSSLPKADQELVLDAIQKGEKIVDGTIPVRPDSRRWGGTLEQAEEYYRKLEPWQHQVVEAAKYGNGTENENLWGNAYLDEYNRLRDLPSQSDDAGPSQQRESSPEVQEQGHHDAGPSRREIEIRDGRVVASDDEEEQGHHDVESLKNRAHNILSAGTRQIPRDFAQRFAQTIETAEQAKKVLRFLDGKAASSYNHIYSGTFYLRKNSLVDAIKDHFPNN